MLSGPARMGWPYSLAIVTVRENMGVCGWDDVPPP